jgi:protein XagA
MRSAVTLTFAILWFAVPTAAAAWTLDTGEVRVFSDVVASRSGRQFGRDGMLDFSKLFVKADGEYGFLNSVTLFATQEYSRAQWTADGRRTVANGATFEAGGRLRLHNGRNDGTGVVSLQISVATVGALGMPVGGSAESKRAETRLLYGYGFPVFGCDGFVDIEVGSRWIDRVKPGEFVADAAVGLWVQRGILIMAQNYNVYREEGFGYRMHKIELSAVGRVSDTLSLRVGYIFTPAGDKAPKEQGYGVSLWYNP